MDTFSVRNQTISVGLRRAMRADRLCTPNDSPSARHACCFKAFSPPHTGTYALARHGFSPPLCYHGRCAQRGAPSFPQEAAHEGSSSRRTTARASRSASGWARADVTGLALYRAEKPRKKSYTDFKNHEQLAHGEKGVRGTEACRARWAKQAGEALEIARSICRMRICKLPGLEFPPTFQNRKTTKFGE